MPQKSLLVLQHKCHTLCHRNLLVLQHKCHTVCHRYLLVLQNKNSDSTNLCVWFQSLFHILQIGAIHKGDVYSHWNSTGTKVTIGACKFFNLNQ